MRDSAFARHGRAVAAHADHLFIAALIAAKLAGVELKVVRREDAPAPEPARPAASDVRPDMRHDVWPDARSDARLDQTLWELRLRLDSLARDAEPERPGGPPAHFRLIGTEAHRAAEENGCTRAPRLFPRPESRREQQRRARGMLYGATPDGPRPRQAG